MMWNPFRDCTSACAVPVLCPVCGRALPPAGRSAGQWIPDCCSDRQHTAINTRHVWDASELTPDHPFQPVAGHPDDDECTHRADGTDATYCGRPAATHESGRWA